MSAMGPPLSVHTINVTLIDSVRPLVSASCSESVLIDCNYTHLGDGMSSVGRVEAKRSASMLWMSARGHVANIHNNIVTPQSLWLGLDLCRPPRLLTGSPIYIEESVRSEPRRPSRGQTE